MPEPLPGEKVIDLHGFSLFEAKVELIEAIIEARELERPLRIIHGYNRGTSIRSFIRNGALARRISKEGFEIRIIKDSPGVTIIAPY